MARRKIERASDLVEAPVPARGWHRAATRLLARHGVEIELRLAQLDASAPVGAFSHQELVVALPCALQRERRQHVEAPVAAHDAVDRVDDGEAPVIEVEPQGAAQRETVVVGVGKTAAALLDRKPGGRVHAKRGVLAPFGRNVRLRRIDTLGTHGRRDPQGVVGGETPDFLAWPFGAAVGPCERCGHTRAAREQHHLVAAGAQLHAQAAVSLETRGQVAPQRQRGEPIGKRAAEQLFACFAGDVQADARQ
jgi:hypothetical protein